MSRAKIAPELLEILACPVPECRGPLEQTDEGLCCRRCRLVYGTEQGWPNLIPEEARPMGDEKPPVPN